MGWFWELAWLIIVLLALASGVIAIRHNDWLSGALMVVTLFFLWYTLPWRK